MVILVLWFVLRIVATLTKQPGIFLVVPLAIELWTEPSNRR